MRKITDEEIESPSLSAKYYAEQAIEAMVVTLTEATKPVDFEFLYGEGSYEEFIFGGAPGL